MMLPSSAICLENFNLIDRIILYTGLITFVQSRVKCSVLIVSFPRVRVRGVKLEA